LWCIVKSSDTVYEDNLPISRDQENIHASHVPIDLSIQTTGGPHLDHEDAPFPEQDSSVELYSVSELQGSDVYSTSQRATETQRRTYSTESLIDNNLERLEDSDQEFSNYLLDLESTVSRLERNLGQRLRNLEHASSHVEKCSTVLAAHTQGKLQKTIF
jgi:hypothetical protein